MSNGRLGVCTREPGSEKNCRCEIMKSRRCIVCMRHLCLQRDRGEKVQVVRPRGVFNYADSVRYGANVITSIYATQNFSVMIETSGTKLTGGSAATLWIKHFSLSGLLARVRSRGMENWKPRYVDRFWIQLPNSDTLNQTIPSSSRIGGNCRTGAKCLGTAFDSQTNQTG